MIDLYDQYIENLTKRLASLDQDSGVAVMLSACERMFFVISRPDTRDACDPSRLRDLLDAMWDRKPMKPMQLSVPDEFELESLADELVVMATDSILMTKEALGEQTIPPERVLMIAVELANAVDAAQDPEGKSDAGSLDAFLRDPQSCASIEAARQYHDIADIAVTRFRADAWASLRARAIHQDITRGLPL